MNYKYERLRQDGTIQYCPLNDYDGEITGQIVIGVKAWFDENPDERIKRGWVKHWFYNDIKELKKDITWDPATEYLMKGTININDYEIKDTYYPIKKPEECMEMEEMMELMNLYVPSGMMILDSQGGALI